MARQFSPLVKNREDFENFMRSLYANYARNAQQFGAPRTQQAAAPQRPVVSGGLSQLSRPGAASPPITAAPVASAMAAPVAPAMAAPLPVPPPVAPPAFDGSQYKAYDPSKAAMKTDLKDPAYKNWVSQAKKLSSWMAQNTGTAGEVGVEENAPLPLKKSYAMDPWTGKIVQTEYNQFPTVEYAGDTQTTRYDVLPESAEKTIERLMERGATSGPVELEAVRSTLKGKKLAEFDKMYEQTQKAQAQFQAKYLPDSLRKQVEQFFPQELDKGMKKFIGNRDYGINTLTASLASRGISDLSKLAIGKDAKGKDVVYDPNTGQEISSGLWAFKGGGHDGNLQYYLKPTKDGRLSISTHFEKPETRGIDIIEAAIPGIILGMAAGPAGAAMGTAMGATGAAAGAGTGATVGAATGAGAGAATGATLGSTLASMAGHGIAQGTAGALGAAMQGGDVGKGALSGLVGGAVGGLGGAYNVGSGLLGKSAPAWQQTAINQGLGGAIKGAVGAQLTGQNVGQGALSGGIGGAVSGGLGTYGQSLVQGQNPLIQSLGRVGTSALTGGVLNRLRGGDFMQGIKGGALQGLGGVASSQLSGLAKQYGLSPQAANSLGGLGSRFLMQQLMRRG